MTEPVSHNHRTAPTRQLSLFDSTCIIVGIVIGAGIYETSPLIAASVPSPAALLLVWAAGGMIALVGGLCYAELATTYPREGGDYVYLSLAYGRRLGFLFAWAEYWIIRPGNVGMMAFVFGRFAHELFPLVRSNAQLDFLVYACGAIVLLTAMNLLGVRSGKLTQNFLTSLKVLGLLLIVAVGLLLVPRAETPIGGGAPGQPDLRLAMILILFTYGGWNEMSYAAAEVRDPERNIFRSLLLGTLIITFVYLAVNLAFLRGLGLKNTASSSAVAADLLQPVLGDVGRNMISMLVCLSCLGSINGMLFTGSRVFYAAGREHRLIQWLGSWNAKYDAPLRALLLQLAATLALVIGFGWYEQGFDRLLHFTAPVFWGFATLVAFSLFLLRWKSLDKRRLHGVFLYPLTPLVFLLSSAFLLHASLTYAWANRTAESLWTAAILLLGLLVSLTPAVRPHETTD